MPGKYRLLGVGWCARYDYEQPEVWKSTQTLDTMFIITNPNCDRNIKLEWMFIIDEDENIEYDGPVPEDYEELSPHQVWEFYLSEYIDVWEDDVFWKPPQPVPKYTVEIMWSGVHYIQWLGWRDSPCTGWMKQLITTEPWEWVEDACLCVGETGNECKEGPIQQCPSGPCPRLCEGACTLEVTVPGVDCSQCDCQCPEEEPCTCQTCGIWMAMMPVTEVSESEMVVYQPARVR